MYTIRKEHSIFINWIPPFLEVLKEKGGSATPKEIRECIVTKLNLSDDILTKRYEKISCSN